ncbi:MAG: hypothetical protein AB4058_21710, partial [Microcystaceae cyanobacterium]
MSPPLENNNITITHFCTKTGKLLQDYDPETGKFIPLTTEIPNSVLGAWFPDQTYYYGEVYDSSTKEEILKGFNGTSLQFSDQEKFLFDGDIRGEVFPNLSDAAVRFGMMKTECQEMRQVTGNFLMVDDEDLSDQAVLEEKYGAEVTKLIRQQLGDGFGVVSPTLHQQMTGSNEEGNEGRKNTPFQFRMGAAPQKELQGYWESKGMIGTWNQFPQELAEKGINGIIPKSCVKIGSEHTQAGETYNLTVDVGIKDFAGRTLQKLGPQAGNILMANPPITDEFLKLVEEKLEELALKLENPYYLSQDFLEYNQEKYQQRAADEFAKRNNLEGVTYEELLEQLSEDAIAELETEAEALNTMAAYHILSSEHGKQLIDHPYIVSALEKHVQQRYKDIVTISFEKWNRATLLPGKELEPDEFCDSKLPDGAQVVVSRSPNASANSFVTLTNVHHPLYMTEARVGSVYMNPQTAKLIQGDFDGDNVYYEQVSKKPYLQKFVAWQQDQLFEQKQTAIAQYEQKTGENGDKSFTLALAAQYARNIEERLKTIPDEEKGEWLELHKALSTKVLQSYRELTKNKKQKYDQEEFAEIALAAKDDTVGLIANNLMHGIAIENEVNLYPEAKKQEYLEIASAQLIQGFCRDKIDGEWVDTKGVSKWGLEQLSVIGDPESIRLITQDIGTITDSRLDLDTRLTAIASLAHHQVEVMSKQLQIGVDSMKSAERPSEEIMMLS